ncbi:MAG: helicase, superfamily [Actinomycetia bacterium]|nr:helicase, superfamily [Actinomycetes bacterium]
MSTSFADLGVSADLIDALNKRQITEPFPIQVAAIPDALAGRDISGRAPTGSGKTLAFGIPMVERVPRARRLRPGALVLAPTRELAAQIQKDLLPLAKTRGRRVIAVYGGVGYETQIRELRRGIDILVACPGRLIDLVERRAVELDGVEIVVIDEADRMADMGFLPQVRKLLDLVSENRQTILFSATLDGDIGALARDYQHDPVRHEVGEVEPDLDASTHAFWHIEATDRPRHTATLINQHGSTIVFCRTRHGADRLVKQLSAAGVSAASIHGGRSQGQRDRALQSFKQGQVDALIATDVAARGIHVDGVACVVHFDLAEDAKAYLHRSGRTGRAGASGVVVTLVSDALVRDVRKLQRDIGLEGTLERVGRAPAGAGSGSGSKPTSTAAPTGATPRRNADARPARHGRRPESAAPPRRSPSRDRRRQRRGSAG